jgi:hypothetical protein
MGTPCDLSWLEIVMNDKLSLYQYEMSLIIRSCRLVLLRMAAGCIGYMCVSRRAWPIVYLNVIWCINLDQVLLTFVILKSRTAFYEEGEQKRPETCRRPTRLIIWISLKPILFKNFRSGKGLAFFWGCVPKLRIIFGEILLRVEGWVY